MNLLKKIQFSLKGILFLFLLTVMMSFAVNEVSAQTYWVQDAAACPVVDEANYPGQNCAPTNICGDLTGTAQCYDTSTLTPPTSTTTETGTNNPGGSPGFWLDCYDESAGSSPYCSTWECNYDSSCYTVNRTTECNDVNSSCGDCQSGYQECDGSIADVDGCEVRYGTTAFPGEANAHYATDQSCIAECNSGYIDCNGDLGTGGDGCEIRTLVTQYGTEDDVVYNASCNPVCDGTFIDCDGDIGTDGTGCEIEDTAVCFIGSLPGIYDGCFASAGNCVIDKSYFETGTKTSYSSMDPLLWGTQYGGGALMELINYNASTTGGIFHVSNDGSVGIGTNTPSAMLTVGVDAGSQFLVNGVGTVTGGTWEGDMVGVDYGGTGKDVWTAGSIVIASSSNEFGEILKSASSSMLLSINVGGNYEWITQESAGLTRTDSQIQDVAGLMLDGNYDGGLLDIAYNDTLNTIDFDIENNLSAYTNDANFITLTSLSASTTQGLAFNSSTGEFYVDPSYNIPLTASTTEWAEAYSWGDYSLENYFSLNGGPLSILNGGTGSTTVAGARANLGLGSLAQLNTINNDNWSGTDLAVDNGGTGRSSWTQFAIPYMLDSTTFTELTMGATGTILKVNDAGDGYIWAPASSVGLDTWRSDEEIEDLSGGLAMDADSVQTLISVSYNDASSSMDFVVDNDLSHYSNLSSLFITLNSLSASTTQHLAYDSGTGEFYIEAGYGIPLSASSTEWAGITDLVNASSSDWTYAYDEVFANSSAWDSASDIIIASSTNWNDTHNLVTLLSGDWDDAYSWGDWNLENFFSTTTDILDIAYGGTGATNTADMLSSFGLVVGTDVQAYNADLLDIAGLTHSDGNFMMSNAGSWTSNTPANARTALGLGTIYNQDSDAVSITGGSISGITELAVADGGTGRSSWNQYAIPYMTNATTFGEIQIATSSFLLAINGTATGYEWVDVATVGNKLTQEEVEDYAGALVENVTGTHSLITVTYDDATNDMDFIVSDDLSLYDNGTSSFITLNDFTSSISAIDYATTTGIFTLNGSYIIPTSASTSEYDTAFGWGNHAIQNYFDLDDGALAIANGGTGSTTAAGARTELGLEIGLDVQAYDSDLVTMAGLNNSDSNFIVGSASGWVVETGLTARTSLGLGTVATQDADSVNITGGSITGITDLAVADGGTGRSSWTQYAIPYMTSSTTFGEIGIGTNNYLLAVNGTTGYDWVDVNTVGTQLTQEQVEDYAGLMVALGTGNHSLITVTYDDTNNDMDFIVENDLSLYNNSTSSFITLSDLSEDINGITLSTTTTGIFSLTAGYVIPTTASTTEYDTAYGWGNHSTQNYFDLDDGALAIANGGTGSTSLDNLITLGTHTTGNYLANATGTGSILVTGALGEGVTRYIDVIDDSITPTELNVSGNGGDTNILTSNGAGGFTWVAQGSVGTDTVLSQEQVEDYTGVLMATSSPYSLITVAYNDNAGLPGTMNFTVNDDLSLYDNSTSSFFSTISDILDVVNGGTGLNTLTQNALIYASSSSEFGQLGIGASSSILQINATGDGYVWAPPGSVGVDTKLSQEEVEDFAGTLMATSSPYALIEVVYDDVSDQMSFNVTADLSQFSNATSSFITWSSLESQAVGLDYSTTTGIFSLASGYEIPTTANTLSWTNTATLVSASSSSWTQAFDWGDHSTFNYFIKGTDVLSIADGGTNATNTADALTNLGLVIGTDVQAYDADLMTFAGISPQTDIVNFLSAADNAAAQTSLGLGSMATQNEGSVSISGGTITGITDLTVADGGTGRSSWTQYAIPFMTDSTTFGQVGIGASSTLLRVNSAGTGYEWVSASGVGVDTTLTQENVEDYAGAMIGTTTLITITYNDNIDGKIEFTVENDLALYDNSNSLFFSTTTDVLGIDYGGTGSTTALGARENLGLAIGTDIQEYNSNLATIAGLAHNTDYFMISNGTDWDTQSTSSVRSTLGLGTMAIQDATSVSITGGSITGITDLAVADGGTGRSSWTQYAIPYMTDSTTFGQVGIGASSTLLRVNAAGTGYEWVSASGVGVDTTLTQENVEDYAGAMVANPTGTHSLITITYDDTNGDMDFIVSDDLSLYDNGTSSFITLNDLTSSIAAITYATSTGIFTLDGSYIIPTTASTSEYDTAFAWGDHSTFNYFVKGTDVLSIADGGTGSSTAAGARTELGLEIGTDVQAFDSVLLTYAGIDPSSDIQTFLGSDNNSIARNNLGLGSLATLSTVNNDNWSGSDLAVDNGGTGRSSWTQYAIPYMTGTTTFGEIEIATSSYLLSVNGTGDGYEWVDVNTVGTQLTQEQVEDYAGPLMAAASPYSLISVTYNDGSNNMDFVVNDDLSLYSNATSSFFSTDGGVLAIANGGTGSSTAIGARTELGLEIGADVQAFDSVLLTYAGIDPSSDIQTFLGSNSSSTARTSLGLGTMAIQNEGSVSIIGGSITGITDLAVADGGTGRSTWTPYAIPYMTSSTTFGEFAIGTSTYLLQVNGTEDGYEWVDVNTVGTQLNQEQVEDYAGAFVARATGDHSFLSITYQDGSDDMDFILNTDLDLYDNGTSSFINLTELSASSTQGLTYDNINGEFSVTSGRIIPLSASTTLWNNTYNLVNASSSDWTTAFDWGNHATQGYFDLDDGALAIINGGTGSTTAAGARTELGLEIGADVQAWNNNLDDIVGLTHGTDLFMVSNGTDWDTQSSTTVRTTLGLANVFTNSDYAINSAGTLGDVWLSDGSGVGGWSATNTLGLIGLDVINSLNSGYVPYSDGTNLINSGVYYDGTNVGIGTSTAGFLLTIGATSTDQFLVNNIGQITDGTWMGDTIDIAYGGTGVTNVADFLNYYDLEIGTNTQAWSTELDDIAGIEHKTNLFMVSDGSNWSTPQGTSTVRSTLGLTDAFDNSTYLITTPGNNGEIWMSDGTGAGIWTATSSLGLLGSSTISNLTNNYISKWNGTAFANSVLYDNGTNLALGTTTASSLLTVGATSTDQFLVNNIGQVTDGTWTGDTIGLAYGGTGNTTFTNGSIVFSNGTILTEDNSSFFWDDTNKYLGLGTSSPRSQLEVYSGSADSILTITSANGTNDPLIQFLTGTSSTAKFTMGVDATDSNKFKIAPGTSLDGSDVFVIDEYGNTIISNLQLGAQVFAADSGAITWTDMPVTSAVPAGTEQSLSALIDGETMLTLYAESDGLGGIQNQRIGVGTSSPQSMLTVYGDVLVEGANRYLNFGATTSDVGYGFYDNGGTIQIKHDNGTWTDIGSGVVNSGTAGYLPYFATTGTSLTATSAIFLLNEMIGIGTTSPSSMFTVGATSTNQFLVNNIGQILDGTWMGDTIGLAYGGTGNTAFTNGSIVFSNGTILTQDNSNFFWDDSNNYLGLGTSTPSAILTVGATSTDQFLVNNIGQITDGTWMGDTVGLAYGGTGNTSFTNGSIVFSNGTILTQDNSNFFWDDANSYLGLGTSTPNYLLDITASSSANYLTSIYNTGTATTSGGLFVRSDGEGALLNLNYNGTDVFTVTGAETSFNNPVSFGSTGDVSFGNDLVLNNDTASHITFTSAGYIETDSTWQNLDLTLSAAQLGDVIVDDTFVVTGTTTIADLLYVNYADEKIGIGTSTPAATLDIFGTAGGNIMNVASSSGDSLFHISENGNVGIGTTSPSSILTVGATSTDQFLVNNIGQITDGTWMGDTIDIAYGGTGVTNVADFLNYYDLEIGTNTQAWSTELDDIAGIEHKTNLFMVSDGSNWSTPQGTSTVRSTLGLTDAFDNSTYLITTPGNNGEIWMSDGTGAGIWTATSSLGLLGSSTISNLTNNYISKWNGTAFANSVLYDNGTNLALGTTTASSLLTVGGTLGSQFLVNSSGQVTDGEWLGDTIGLTYGGTGNTSFTEGSIVFANGGILNEDNTNFFWDDTNNRLGIGTVSPGQALTLGTGSSFATEMAQPTSVSAVAGTGSLTADEYFFRIVAEDGLGTTIGSTEISTSTSFTGLDLSWTAPAGAVSYRVYFATTTESYGYYFANTDTTYTFATSTGGIAASLPSVTTAYVNKFTASGDSWMLGGNIGIGTTTPTNALTVSGLFNVSGTGTSTISDNLEVLGTLKVGTGSTYIDSNSITFTGDSSIISNSGDITLAPASGNLVVEGDIISAGTVWATSSAAEANSWLSVTYGNGLFVAVSDSGTNQIMTSPDGINWTARSAAEANSWNSVTYGNGLFVAVSEDGTNRVMTSPDGINWTARSATEDNGWQAVTYGNGLFVAVSADGTNQVMTSPDGINWTARSAAEANWWRSVTYGNGLFVAVSLTGTNQVMTSPDGISWTARSATEVNWWRSVTYGNGLFVAVSSNGTNRVMTSSDGISWTARSAAEINSWQSVTYGDGLFVAVSSDGTNRVMTSPDGISWTARAATVVGISVTYGNGTFVSVGNSDIIYYSGKQQSTQLAHNNTYQGGMNIFGNVGIGTSSPSSMLTVGATSTDQFLVNNIGQVTDGTWMGDIIGLGYGGTGTSTAFTAGSILFSDGTSLAQNNSNFFWDDTNNRLGIGTSTPSATLDIFGTVGDDILNIASSSGDSLFHISNNGNIGIGSTSPQYNLAIEGTLYATDIYTSSSTFYMDGTPLLSKSTGDLVLSVDTGEGINMTVDGTSALYINASGNIGIGTVSPDLFKLQVAGNIGPNTNNTYSLGGVEEMAMDTDLSTADASFWGEDASDGSGISVSGIGDINGDGYDDFAIGAKDEDDGGSNAGQTYVIMGTSSGWAMDTDLSAADASFWGEYADDWSGNSVSGIGDINGDGYDDFAIGAWGNDDGGSAAGQTYVIFGKASGWAMDTELGTSSDASFWGEDSNDVGGRSVSGIGDINGDGYDDFAIGAWGDEDGGDFFAGQTYIILGKASGWAMDTDLSAADASFWGEDASDQAGYSVSGIGDTNGDGYDDFAIGAYRDEDGGSDAGQTYVILGKASGWAMDTDLSTADASFWGEDAGDYSGYSVSGIGDINGDGYADFAIGAYGDDDGGSGAGQTYVILGKASGWAMDTELGTSSDASFWGEDAGDYSGYSVSGIGDINGDGYADFAIGADGDEDGGSAAGQTYIILGKDSGWEMDIELGTSSDASFWGEDASDNSGASVSGIGDINGDGYDDFAIGAYGDDDGGIAAGQTYVILGKPRQFDSVIARHLNAGESLSVGTNLSIHGETITADSQLYLDANMVNINGGLSTTGNVGIGTSSPNSLIDIYSASPADTDIIFSIATATNVTYKIQADGTVYSDNAYNATGADYAEYFYTEDTDLVSGEVVCVDILNDNAVARCYRESDTNVMGIVSSNPSIIGNSKDTYKDDKNMVIVGMLGQVPARVTDENGSIRPGDSLTSASLAGYLMRASSSAPTVGVALESLDSGIGNINVLISRKNKSITVEEVEEKVTERIAAMEIEDEVNILIANAVDSLNLDDQISSIVDDELLLVDARLTIEVDTLTGLINNNKSNINNLMSRVAVVENDITDIKSRLDMLDIGTTTNPITSDTFAINEDGTIRLGNNIDNNISTTTIGTSTVEIVDAPVAIVDIEADSELTAFVVNQVSSGDVADFQSDGVSIVNIANEGEVRVVGEMLVDGRIMLCSGGSCGDALDNAVDETMGDMGVEGKVVAGAFENYCDEGFVWVEGSAKYGTMPGFCVMSDEAKFADMNGDGIAEMDMLVDLQGPTWDNMNQGEAKLTCESLGSGYHLISENEWMTIADSIIKVADNDMDDELEGLQLESPLKRSGCETDEVCLATTATSTVQILANGNEISNIGAGLGEWTDKIVTKAGVPTPLTNDWQEFYAVEDYKGFNIIPPYYYSSENGIGMIKTGDNDQAMRGFVRGTNGVFSLDISNSPVIATSTIGFRCAK